jgi:hypothetical protein
MEENPWWFNRSLPKARIVLYVHLGRNPEEKGEKFACLILSSYFGALGHIK